MQTYLLHLGTTALTVGTFYWQFSDLEMRDMKHILHNLYFLGHILSTLQNLITSVCIIKQNFALILSKKANFTRRWGPSKESNCAGLYLWQGLWYYMRCSKSVLGRWEHNLRLLSAFFKSVCYCNSNNDSDRSNTNCSWRYYFCSVCI